MRKEALRILQLFAFNVTLLFLIKVLGRLLAALPECVVAGLCRVLALLISVFRPERRWTTLRSLSHAFPDRPESWRRRIFRESSAHLIEMALFRPASAYFSPERLDRCVEICSESAKIIEEYAEGGDKHGHPVVIMLPHMTMSEAGTMFPARAPGIMQAHVIFRPLNQPSLSRWVTEQREKHGANLISRRDGYNDAMAALRRGELVAVLFDQDASNKGSTITFMDRIVSATDLPALMAHRFDADIFLMLLERQGFWKAKLSFTAVPRGESPVEATIRAHDELEQYLRRDDATAADWLWLHDRWDHFYSSHKRFRLPEKRNELERSNRIHGYATVPRKTRFWVRLPNWLGDVVMALPVLRTIREARPDFEFTLIGKAAFEPLVERLGVADHFMPLPERGAGYFPAFFRKRLAYPDTYLMLTNSFRGDLEAFLTRCPQRFGMLRPGKRRPLLSAPYELPENVDEARVHQTSVWEGMARYYGLKEPLGYEPVRTEGVEKARWRVGLICGTENSPEKRWPVERWRELIEALLAARPQSEVVLYGTPADRAITDAVGQGFAPERVRNLAGQTNLAQFCDELAACAVIACNDTGGMHLANMLGTPTVAVFGPTNPVRTGPVFTSPHTLLQPEGCPPTGGMPIEQVSVERCLEAILESLPTDKA